MTKFESCSEQPVVFHEYAKIFPMLDPAAHADLVADIRKNGVLDPIVKYDGQILDGRNRYMAARECGIEYPWVEYAGDDPLGFVISKNLARRHLSESQRAMVATKIAKLDPGSNQHAGKSQSHVIEKTTETGNGPIGLTSPTQEDAAKVLNVSTRSIKRATKVEREAESEVCEAVERGDLPLNAALKVSTLPPEDQRKVAAAPSPKQAAREATQPKQEEKKTPSQRSQSQAVKDAIKAAMALPSPEYAVTFLPANSVTRRQLKTAGNWFVDVWKRMPKDPLEGDALDIFNQRCRDNIKRFEKGTPGFSILGGCIASYNRGSCPSQKQIDSANSMIAEVRIAVDSVLDEGDT